MKELETERLILRPFQVEDREEIHRLVYADPQVAPSWTGRTWTLDEITESFARKLAQRPNGLDFQAIVLKATREMIGLIGFQLYEEGEIEQSMTFEHATSRRAYDPEFFEVEITYALGHAFWHKGYATEAGRALIEHGFRELNIGRIVNSVAAENVHSVKLMKRLGLHIERSLKPKPFSGPWQNSAGVIGILENPHWQKRGHNATHSTNVSGSSRPAADDGARAQPSTGQFSSDRSALSFLLLGIRQPGEYWFMGG